MIEDTIEKRYFSMREAFKMTGVRPSTIRFYEKALGIELAVKSIANHVQGKRRHFSAEDIERIKLLKEVLKYCHLEGLKMLIQESHLTTWQREKENWRSKMKLVVAV